MKKLIAAVLALTLCLCLLSGCSKPAAEGKDLLARIREKGSITIAMEGTWAPWTYHDESDKLDVGIRFVADGMSRSGRSHGHLACVFVRFDKKPTKEEMLQIWKDYRGVPQELGLPTAPKQFIHYFEEDNRPQTGLDRNLEGGMAISVGRLREDTQYDYKFVCLSHNTLRGAAGGGVLSAELLYKLGYFD